MREDKRGEGGSAKAKVMESSYSGFCVTSTMKNCMHIPNPKKALIESLSNNGRSVSFVFFSPLSLLGRVKEGPQIARRGAGPRPDVANKLVGELDPAGSLYRRLADVRLRLWSWDGRGVVRGYGDEADDRLVLARVDLYLRLVVVRL